MTNAPKIAKDKSPLVADLPTACANEDAAVAFIERWKELRPLGTK